MGHERNVLWAAHSVHHQSQDYNLSTALRQTSTGFLLSGIFYLPLAVLGVPLVVFISVASLNLLYQFWVHTRHVPQLGWYGSQLRRGIHPTGLAVRHLPGGRRARAGDLRRDHAAGQLEPAMGQPAVLCAVMGRCPTC